MSVWDWTGFSPADFHGPIQNPFGVFGLVRQLVLDAETGKFVTYGSTPADSGRRVAPSIGGGHSGFRVLPVGGRWWFPNIVDVYGNVDPSVPTDAEKF